MNKIVLREVGRRMKSMVYLYLILLGIYILLSAVFLIGNYSEFDDSASFNILRTFIYGLRFDISGIFFVNILWAILWLIPVKSLWKSKIYTRFLKLIFVVANGFFIILNAIDTVYFPFVKKRMQRDAFLFFTGDKGTEAFTLLPQFLLQFWYIWLLALGLIVILIVGFKKVETRVIYGDSKVSPWALIGLITVTGIHIVGMRGGLQLRPITLLDAGQAAGVKNIPFVVNSTFSLIRTWGKKDLQAYHYFDEDEIDDCQRWTVDIQPTLARDSKNENVIIIIVESLSKEYLSYYDGTGKTPFLDSLMSHSLVYHNGFANGRESVQGVPAVVASLPSWMDDAFIFSKYNANRFNSLASVLKEKGYSSAFFHGAGRGSMGFYSFSKSAGFDDYYAKEDYPNPNHEDGSWGIWDHYFLPFMVDKVSEMKPPFLASVLTLNTHHPFKVPEDFVVSHPSEVHPILNSLQYVDHALFNFFDYASKMPWYSNTLFVITGDHTGPLTVDKRSDADDYRIPFIFYRPDNSLSGSRDDIFSQVDIMPTVLDMIGVENLFFAVGKPAQDTFCVKNAINYKQGLYRMAYDKYYLYFDGEKTIGFFDMERDPMLVENLMEHSDVQSEMKEAERILKMQIQGYNYALINNKMLPDE